MNEYRTNWASLEGRDAISETTGGALDYRKWVAEPNATGKWMRKFLPMNSRICDFGCGAGRNAGILRNYFDDVICTDLHPNISAQSDYPLNTFPYGNEFSAQGILSAYVMQHIPSELFPEHFRILKESKWEFLFTLEVENEFGYDFHKEILEFSSLIEECKWPFEPQCGVLARVYKREK